MIAPHVARAGARCASLIAVPLLGSACGSPQQRAGDATIVRAAAQAQASVSAYERAATPRSLGRPTSSACGTGLRPVALSAETPPARPLFGAPSDASRCAAYR
ncbi:hypothetical protein K7957_13245 [Sphingomonas yunnanensis]|uniref:hypothetical protein n=1 Tax=Sphingomonas yunnanensis TaxID=310400 RepID=UPI001CA6FD9D|nr:hypothetical protein [Sphingomonas yunnanensis]MBY9063903.1 hypothetical protein [Sphingomonas yunnanensis]